MATITANDGTRLAYEDHGGGGRPMVLVHGITESRRAWDPALPALTATWRVVAVDVRGHGESERRAPYDAVTLGDDLGEVVRALGLEAPLVVGHSMGAIVATMYGSAGHPARGIVNIDQPLALADFQAALEPLAPMLRGTDEEFRQAVQIVFSVLDGPLPPAERARLDALSSPEPDVVLGIWAPVLELPAADLEAMALGVVGGVRVPYLAIHGSDPGLAYVEWLVGAVARARVEVWPDEGHYPHLLDPERFAERLEQFDRAL